MKKPTLVAQPLVSSNLIIALLIGVILFMMMRQAVPPQSTIIQQTSSTTPTTTNPYYYYGFDTFLNPYSPPFRDERTFYQAPAAPVPTQQPAQYRQLGIITSTAGTKDILPLMGRPLIINRDKWQYYTISNQHNNIKLPILVNGRNGLNEYGVNQIYSKDTIFVEGYNEEYVVTVYENLGNQIYPAI
jgi:hypothetical protein